jgi:hypothetical protein
MTDPLLDALFARCEPAVADIYAALVAALAPLKPLRVQPKKSSIHLAGAKSAFAGVHPRKTSVLLNIRTALPLKGPRIKKIEKVSAHRFHNELRLEDPADIDKELLGWLRDAHRLSAQPASARK